MRIVHDTNDYMDRPEKRVLDLRPDGADCIPVLGVSNYQIVRSGPEFHVHDKCVEVVLCLRGNLAFETPEREYPFHPGSIFVSTPTEPHRMRTNPKGLKIYRILFQIPKGNRTILSLPKRDGEWIVRSIQHLPKRLFRATDAVKTAFDRLFELYDNEPRHSASRPAKIRATVVELLIAIIEAARSTPRKAPERIVAIAKRIESHPDGDYHVEDLAHEAGLATVSFAELFKLATGLPPHAYLISCRINAAKRMLAKDTRTIRAISDMLRFATPQHFANVFNRTVGMTPTAYRRQTTLT